MLLDRSHFMDVMRQGKTLTVTDPEGHVHTVAKANDQLGYYKVDGKRNHTLEGIYVWFGYYHIDYGAAVINGKIK